MTDVREASPEHLEAVARIVLDRHRALSRLTAALVDLDATSATVHLQHDTVTAILAVVQPDGGVKYTYRLKPEAQDVDIVVDQADTP